MKRIALFNKEDAYSQTLKQNLETRLMDLGYQLDEKNPELVVSIGGDGTFLRTIHQYVGQLNELVFVGIHTGTLGFFTEYLDTEVDIFIDDLINHSFDIKKFPLLKLKVIDQEKTQEVYALNEIRIENIKRSQCIDIDINQHHFETFRGTGFCISTQIGSTAYNRSLGGAIVHEGMNVMQLTEISGIHHKAYRSLASPLIISSDSKIRLTSSDFSDALVGYDHLYQDLKKDSIVEVEYSPEQVRVWDTKRIPYLKRLMSSFS